MLLTNRQAQYKYSSTGLQIKQENEQKKKNFTKGRFTFLGKAFKMGVVICVLGLIIIFYVNQYAQISSMNYQIHKLKNELNTLNRENEKVRLQIAENKSLQYIEKEARGRLGLVDPKTRYITVQQESESQVVSTKETNGENKLALFVGEVGEWFKNLTSVEAGTLDE